MVTQENQYMADVSYTLQTYNASSFIRSPYISTLPRSLVAHSTSLLLSFGSWGSVRSSVCGPTLNDPGFIQASKASLTWYSLSVLLSLYLQTNQNIWKHLSFSDGERKESGVVKVRQISWNLFICIKVSTNYCSELVEGLNTHTHTAPPILYTLIWPDTVINSLPKALSK